MVKMFVLICVIWAEGSRYESGEQKCIMHQSKVFYATMEQCRNDIIKSELLIEAAIFDNFGDEPIDHQIMASCMGGV